MDTANENYRRWLCHVTDEEMLSQLKKMTAEEIEDAF